MSAKMKEYRYYLSSGVNTSVRVKISMLELAPGAAVSLAGDLLVPPPAPSSSRSSPPVSSATSSSSVRAPPTSTAPLRAFSAPMLTQRCVASPSELRNATISEIFVTAQVFADGVPLHPMAISSKGPTKCSESTIYWNEWLTLPVRYRDLSRNAQLVLSVWGVGWQPIGGTTLRLFSTPGVLRDGMQCLRIWRDVAADSAPWTTTPGEMDDDWTNRECFRLDKLREKYERKEMARNEWMDGVTDRRIARIRRGSEPPGRRDPLGPFCSYRQDAVMWIELPYFGDVVVYEEEPYAQRSHSAMTAASVMAQEMAPKRAPGSSSGVSANAPSSLPSFVGTDGYGYDTPSATSGSSSSSLVVVWDPDLHEDNPAERKYRKLARDILRGSIDPNLKPSRDEKARIEELLAMPTDSLRNEDKDLLWKFRYTLTDNKKAVVKFLLSVDWNDETEVKQATDLLHQWCEIDIADALKLLGRDKEFKHEVVRNFAVSTLAKAKNEDLLDFLLQLVQALRYEKMTTSSARAGAGAGGSANGVSSSRGGAGAAANNTADETGSTDGPLTNESFGPLARFLISRCSNDFQMANYFYWYLKVEASDFGRDADMFLAVLNQMCDEMKHDPERRPNYDMLMSQQDLMQKILQFHNKAREEKGRKDQKEEKFKQLLKGFPWPRGSVIRMPLDPTIHLSGIVPSSVKMFKSAMYPAVLQFQTVLPHEPPPQNSQQQHMSHTSRSSMANGSILDTSGTGSSMMSSSGMLSRASQAGIDEKSLLRETLSTRVIHYLNREREGPMVKIMVKNGDDLRQDQLIMQMFILMDRLLKKVNLDLKLTPYRILATGTTDGLMEFVQDSVPVSYIVANFESPQILSFLRSHHPDPNGPYRVSAEALSNYVKSVAGYCVLTYILGIGDRHLDNLMMKTAGHLFHIDFGFIFGADPKPYPPPFKLTKEMVEGMGGPESEHYLKFKTYCCQAYNWLRKSADLILNLLSLMADGGIEMLSNDPETTLQKVQEKFRLDLTDEQAEQFFLGLINDSVTALFPVLVEYIHKWATKLK
ncbi:hypothetical protein PINS_up001470 [Pythium insidiosum]|nr:hypothetical protein PINS_up001470 [Pythium insidiosum]